MKIFLLTLIFILKPIGVAEEGQKFLAEIKPMMKTYCFTCHNEKKKKGKLRLDNLEFIDGNQKNLLLWQEIVDQLTTADMPPEDEKMPTPVERQKLIKLIQKKIDSSKINDNQTVLRRLNRQEYENTIRDLFEMRMDVFMGASKFPPDERHHNFANNAEALITSTYLMDKYMDAANVVVEQILPQEKPKVKSKKYILKPPFSLSKRDLSSWFYGKTEFQDLVQNDSGLRLIYLTSRDFEKGVPERGFYKIRVTVEGKNRQKDRSALKERFMDDHFTSTDEPLSMKLAAGTKADGDIRMSINSDTFIGEFELPDDKVHVVETTSWLEKGYTLKIAFPQGLDSLKPRANKVWRLKDNGSKIPEFMEGVDLMQYMDVKKFEWMKTAFGRIMPNKSDIGSAWASYMEQYVKHFPTLRVYKIEVEGPFYKEWPHRPQTKLLGGKPYQQVDPEEAVFNLAKKAFRRPVRKEEIQPILKFVKQTYTETGSKREAIANGVRAVLCSPQFYYLHENEGQLNDFALASRLSYFLWSTMPDKRLMKLAVNGELRKDAVLKEEVARMLADPRSKALTRNLADQWLELWKLGSMPPSDKIERQYYRRNLKFHSKFETTELLNYILQKNRPVMEILSADYTFMNRGLAEFYGIKNFYEFPLHEYIKTPVTDKRRYGVLGHMGLLTASANGVDTSPIIRGLWVYETILGEKAPPPPDSVPAIEPDIRNAKTIRDKLEKHRADKNCSVCHKRFDHFGYALENFDALGRWRTDYLEYPGGNKRRKPHKAPIDSQGQMVTSEKFDDIVGMRQQLLKQDTMFSKTVAAKLFTQAIGRELNAFDRAELSKILTTAKEQGNGFQDMLKAVVTSKIFRSK